MPADDLVIQGARVTVDLILSCLNRIFHCLVGGLTHLTWSLGDMVVILKIEFSNSLLE